MFFHFGFEGFDSAGVEGGKFFGECCVLRLPFREDGEGLDGMFEFDEWANLVAGEGETFAQGGLAFVEFF